MTLSNKTLGIIAGVIVVGSLLHIEYRVNTIADKVDAITEIINDELVDTNQRTDYTPEDLDCLTKNVYYEAGIEGETGKYAVASVTLNRVKAGNWGDNVCKVVYAKKQFSWTALKKLPKPDDKIWKESREVAIKSLNGRRVTVLDKSMYYHADYIKTPNWVDHNHYVTQIGRHKFYNRAKFSNVYF